jgi:hypothetical protein
LAQVTSSDFAGSKRLQVGHQDRALPATIKWLFAPVRSPFYKNGPSSCISSKNGQFPVRLEPRLWL